MTLDDPVKAAEIAVAWETHRASRADPRASVGRWRRAQRDLAAERQGWRCCWCNGAMNSVSDSVDRVTLEHIVPRSHGGTDDPSNLAAAHLRCNRLRANDATVMPPFVVKDSNHG